MMGPAELTRSGTSGSHLGNIELRKEVPENRNKFFFHLNSTKRQTAPVQLGPSSRFRQKAKKQKGKKL